MIEHDADSDLIVAFGSYRFFPVQRLLLDGERPVSLGGRAIEILRTLLQHRGEVVSKQTLIARAWPDTSVGEANLRIQVAAIRRALGDGREGRRYIVSVLGRGYSFAAPVVIADVDRPPTEDGAPTLAISAGLPVALTRVIGRAEAMKTIVTQLRTRRLVTVVGPGGIGKTTVAVAAAREMATHLAHGVIFLDLATVNEPALVSSALVTALGLRTPLRLLLPAICAFLERRQALLLIDNCEHVIEASAVLIEDILNAAPGVQVLATSREPLRAAEERVYRLGPLESPPWPTTRIDATEALSYSGVALFVERAAETLGTFELLDEDAPAVAEICRSLDGIALAIELAARRVDALSVRELSIQLSDRFRLLTQGRRTARPRHQTLTATLDWSYQLLPEPDQRLLRQLAIFVGQFSLEDAVGLTAGAKFTEVASQVADLVAKSLLSLEGRGPAACYRMLETMRLFCLGKVEVLGELDQLAYAHAEHLIAVLSAFDDHRIGDSGSTGPSHPASFLPDMRAALDWAFSGKGVDGIARALTVRAVPLWIAQSLVGECRDRVERVFALQPPEEGSHASMVLNAALGWALMYTAGSPEDVGAAWARALACADAQGDTSYLGRCLWGLWIHSLNTGSFRAAMERAEQFQRLAGASVDHSDMVMAHRMLGTSLHFLGEQRRAEHHLERAVDRTLRLTPHVRSRTDRPGSLRWAPSLTRPNFLARVAWLLGQPERAIRLAQENIDESFTFGDELSLVHALGQGACPIALWSGDLAAAERFGSLLVEHATRQGLRVWSDWARCFGGIVKFKLGDRAALDGVRVHLSAAGQTLQQPRYLLLLGELAMALGQTNAVTAGLDTIEHAIQRSEANEELWLLPELLRAKGELLRLGNREAEALVLFQRGIELAQCQGALSWVLRLGISITGLQRPIQA